MPELASWFNGHIGLNRIGDILKLPDGRGPNMHSEKANYSGRATLESVERHHMGFGNQHHIHTHNMGRRQ